MAKRTDVHRPGAIIPAMYEYVFSYNGATTDNGWPIPSFGVNCELDRRTLVDDKVVNGKHNENGLCCVVGMLRSGKKFVGTGSTGQCSICSTHFVYGDIWLHVPTGEYLHVGHNCADKYEMLANRSAWEMEHGRAIAAAAVQVQKALNAEARAAFLSQHPGLAEDLELNHPILNDMKRRFIEYRSLTDKQIAFARKLAHEVRNPKPTEAHVPAVVGKGVTVTGEVVSLKWMETDFGSTPKMTVKMTTDAGTWLAWGTAPDSLLGDANGPLKGCVVTFTANFEQGRDPHFAIFKRPRLSAMVSKPAADVAA